MPIAKPFVKWAGNKRSLLTRYEPLFPEIVHHYCEPMVGGGAVFFHLAPRITGNVVLSDVNADLMTIYRLLRDQPDDLLESLERMARQHNTLGEPYYYEVRSATPENDRQRASRLLYLARAAYNGLWRVNSKGQHNVPIGRDATGALYRGEKLFDFANLRAVSRALQGAQIQQLSFFDLAIPLSRGGWFLYVDPPYCPEKVSSFTKYQQGDFGHAEHIALAEILKGWHDAGARIFLSNSDVPLVRELYQEPTWNLTETAARQTMSAKVSGRGVRHELAIRNYRTSKE